MTGPLFIPLVQHITLIQEVAQEKETYDDDGDSDIGEMICQAYIVETMDPKSSDDSSDQGRGKAPFFLYLHSQERDQTRRDDMQERADESSAQRHIDQTYLFLLDEGVSQIEEIFRHAKS